MVLARTPMCYRCNCSRARMEKALIAMGREELGRMIQDEQDGAELTCHFCKKTERFTQQDLLRLLNQAPGMSIRLAPRKGGAERKQ